MSREIDENRMSNDELPMGWSEIGFGELNAFDSSIINPADHPDEEFELYSVPIFPTRKPEIVKGSAIGSTKQTVTPNDVLICKINPRINRVWTVMPKTNRRQIASSEWIAMRAPAMNPEFLRAYFSSQEFREILCEDLTGVGGSLTRAQPKRVAKFRIPIAPLAEQKRIADKLEVLLGRVDACRARLDRVPALLKRFRQAVLAAATSGKLTEEWREQNGVMDEWQTTELATLMESKPRNGYSPKAVDYETPVRSLTLSATTSGRFRAECFKFINEKIPEHSHLWLVPGDILIQRANTIEYVGVSAVFNEASRKFIYPDLMMKCRANERTTTGFLHLLLQSKPVRDHFRKKATGTAGNMPKINQGTVMSAPVSVPTLPEQQEVVRRVEELFAFADRIEARLAVLRKKVERLTPAVLAKAFRGELVPQDPADEPATALLECLREQPIAKAKQATRERRVKSA